MATWTPAMAAKMKATKAAVTRAKNKRDWEAVVAAVDSFEAFMDNLNAPLPDNWALLDNAREDAKFEMKRAAAAGSWLW